MEKLRKSIDYLDQRNAWFAEKLKGQTLTDIEWKIYQAELNELRINLEARKKWLIEYDAKTAK